MTPKINKGDAVLICKVKDVDDVKVGDVITFNYNDKEIVHRLIEIKIVEGKTYYITKGDANEKADSYKLQFDDIVGKVTIKFPFLGYPKVIFNELF